MAVNDGTDVYITLATTLVNGTTSHDFSESWDEIDLTTKDSSKAKEFTTGEYSASIDVSGKLDETDTYTYSELRTAAALRTSVAFVLGRFVVGAVQYSGNALITGLKFSAPKNGEVTWSCTLRATGFPSEGTYATATTSE